MYAENVLIPELPLNRQLPRIEEKKKREAEND